MSPGSPEFSRPLAVDRVPRGGSYEKIAAEAGECLALAKRLDVPALHSLTAEMRATPWRGGGLKMEGSLKADLDRVSIISLEPFRQQVELPILRYFMPVAMAAAAEEAEIDPIIEGLVDLGEVVAETLALELDPYPRRPGESFADAADEPQAAPAKPSPFAALTRLKPK